MCYKYGETVHGKWVPDKTKEGGRRWVPEYVREPTCLNTCCSNFVYYLCLPCLWLISYLMFEVPKKRASREEKKRLRKERELEQKKKKSGTEHKEGETNRGLQEKGGEEPHRPNFGPQLKGSRGPKLITNGAQVKVNYEVQPMTVRPRMKNHPKPKPQPRGA